MRTKLITLFFLVSLAQATTAAEGLISIESNHSVSETIDKLEHILEDKGFNIFARINHGAAAKKAGIELKDTELLIFGNIAESATITAMGEYDAFGLAGDEVIIAGNMDGTITAVGQVFNFFGVAFEECFFCDGANGVGTFWSVESEACALAACDEE